MNEVSKRTVFIDNAKIFAIVFVVLGHFYQSLVLANIVPNSEFYDFFNQTIYRFNTPLFFYCSGYIYQKYSKTNTLSRYLKNVLKKFVALGIPYFVFSLATYIMKNIFSSSVNTNNDSSVLSSLFVHPLSPYWFLFALFFIFLITPTFANKIDSNIRLYVSMFAVFVPYFVELTFLPSFFKTVATYLLLNEVWFLLGMHQQFNNVFRGKKSELYFGIVDIVVFVFVSVLLFKNQKFVFISPVLTLIVIIGILSVVFYIFKDNKQPKFLAFVSKYVMPIFLMHTIFAAGVRTILFKLNIQNSLVHIIFGLVATFVLPVVAAMIMEKIKFDFLYHPTKYIKFSK